MNSHTNVERARNSKNTRKLRNKHQTSKANESVRSAAIDNDTNSIKKAQLNRQLKSLSKDLQSAQRTIARLQSQIKINKSKRKRRANKCNYQQAIDLIQNNINAIPR